MSFFFVLASMHAVKADVILLRPARMGLESILALNGSNYNALQCGPYNAF